MKNPFFSRRVRFFGNVAIMILCAIFFLVPFAVRGARMAVQGIKNDVKDWLPSDFPETRVLDWFRQYFVGDQFVAVSWQGCNEDDPRYRLLVQKLRKESLDYEQMLSDEERKIHADELKAHRFGDELGLHTTGDYHIDWGQEREKWLMGHGNQWYYITQTGDLYRWDGEKNVLSGLQYGVERFLTGTNRATGVHVTQFGTEEDNEYYENPERLACRFFKSVLTGPDVLEQLAGEGGSLRQSNLTKSEAYIEANQRLTGSLFGPTPSIGFEWTRAAFNAELTQEQRKKYAEIPQGQELDYAFETYVEKLIEGTYDGKRYRLIDAPMDERLEHWFTFFYERGLEPPARTTCILVTLNEPASKDLSRVVGRPVLGKPRGRIQQLAINECGVLETDLHVGGPPNDNVAIDEEGTITLIRLVGISTLVGWTLAYLSFRSIKVSFMVFFVGGISAVSSLGIVWYFGQTLDAILMSMPSLVYVLGLSGAVHIVNYYREACAENGPRGAAETAVRHGWFPCTLAAFTTALGLGSLYASSLIPIQKFGLFAAIGTMVTVILLFTYLPSALHLWSPGYRKEEDNGEGPVEEKWSLHTIITAFWDRVGEFVIKHHWAVNATVLLMMVFFSYGLFRVQTSVQLIKLFDDDAKIIHDYKWLEDNLGRLTPMEIVVAIPKENQLGIGEKSARDEDGEIDYLATDLKFSLLERLETSQRVRKQVEYWFGENRQDIVGHGMSTDAFIVGSTSQLWDPGTQARAIFNEYLEENYEQFLSLGYLKLNNVDELKEQAEQIRLQIKNNSSKKEFAALERQFPDGFIVNATGVKKPIVPPKPGLKDAELWRVSLRLGALKNVDYGEFVSDLKTVVEPINNAYQTRSEILKTLHAEMASVRQEELAKPEEERNELRLAAGTARGKVLVIGWHGMPKGKNKRLDIPEWEVGSRYELKDVVWQGDTIYRRTVVVREEKKVPAGEASDEDAASKAADQVAQQDDRGPPAQPVPDEEFDDSQWEKITTLDRFMVVRDPLDSNEKVDAYLLRAQTDDSRNGFYVWNEKWDTFEKHEIVNDPADTLHDELVHDTSHNDNNVDQTMIFCDTLGDLMANRGFTALKKSQQLFFPVDLRRPKMLERLSAPDFFKKNAGYYDCIVLVEDHPNIDVAQIKQHSRNFIDARDHKFIVDQRTKQAISPTASEIFDASFNGSPEAREDIHVVAEYTGIVPIVYKAQRSLLNSLVRSICLAFVMIALVMMILLRDWRRKFAYDNSLNFKGGMISMLPNVFPIVLIFGAMGHLGVMVDIGSMMTASVAMGVAVDDTIHFLTWFRKGLYDGLDRKSAIRMAYGKVATAMTQTTLIGGLGLAVFAWSTFTPTQRFGVMMLLLLMAALIGDLIFLPALLAGPIGKFFAVRPGKRRGLGLASGPMDLPDTDLVSGNPDTNALSNGVGASDGNGAGKNPRQVTPNSGRKPSESQSLLRRRKPKD